MSMGGVGRSGQFRSAFKGPFLWYVSAALTFIFVVIRAFPLCFSAGIGTLDEPIQIISSQRILFGERPYRDFQVLYGPLGSYIAAAAEWPLRHLLPVVSFQCYVYTAFVLFYCVVCWRFSLVRVARPLFLVGSVLLLLESGTALAPIAFYSLSMTLPVIAVIVLLPFTVAGTKYRRGQMLLCQVVCGVLMASEFLIRINFGVYLVTAVFLTGFAAYVFGKDRPVAVSALRCLIFACIAGCVLLGVFAAAGILSPAIADTREYLSRAVAGRAIPWAITSQLNQTLFKVTIFAVVCLLLGTVSRLRRGSIGFWLVPYLLLSAFFSYAVFRFDSVHILPLMMVSLLLIFDRTEDDGGDPGSSEVRGRGWLRGWFGLPELQLFVLLLVVHQIAPSPLHLGLRNRLLGQPEPPPAALPVASTVRRGVAILSSEASMLDRLDQLRKPSEEIFWASAPGSCQSTYDMCANLALYLAEGVLPKQKIWFFDTPSTPFDDVQRTIIHGLEVGKTPWVGMQDVYVRDPRGIAHREAPLLQNFVQDHYDLVFTSEIPGANRRYSIYARKPNS